MDKIHVNTAELKKAAIDAGYDTMCRLANDANISRTTLSKVYRGIIFPSSDIMIKLTKALNLSPEKSGIIFFGNKLT